MHFLLSDLSLASKYASVSDITSSLEPNLFPWSKQQTASSHWGSDLKNWIGAEAIRRAIHVVLPSLRSTCDTVHCLGEKALFSSWMVNTLPSDIFNSSAISRNFNLQSAKTIFWRFLVFSGTTAEFGRPERSASFVSVRPRLKLAYHLLTVVSDGAESE